VRPTATFLIRFFFFAALLFAAWSFGGLGDVYGRAVIRTAEPGIHALTGFRVAAIQPKPGGLDVFIERGNQRELLPLQPREIFSGIIPFLALVAASPGLSRRRRLRALGIGMGMLFAFDLGLMLLGPYLATPHVHWVNKVIDVFYGFYGLLGYAALPFLLWFWLARPQAVPEG